MDVASLLEPMTPEAPCGPDRSEVMARAALAGLFDAPFSMGISGTETPRPRVDWNATIGEILKEFALSKDVWLAVYLCRAGAQAKRLDIVEQGAVLLGDVLDRYWLQVHPTLEEVALVGRKSACDSLASRGAFLGALSQIPLVVHKRLGTFSGADIQKFQTGRDGEANFPAFTNALADGGAALLAEALAAFGRLQAALQRVDTVFSEKSQGEGALNFTPAYEFIAQLRRALTAFLPAGTAVPDSSGPEMQPADGGAASPVAVFGRLESRDDVVRALGAIEDYYRRKEPSSPVPLLVGRAKEWVNMPFLQILSDIVPASIEEARKVLVLREDK